MSHETNTYAKMSKETNMYGKISKETNVYEDIHGNRFQKRTIHMKRDLQNRPLKDEKRPTKETCQKQRHHHIYLY